MDDTVGLHVQADAPSQQPAGAQQTPAPLPSAQHRVQAEGSAGLDLRPSSTSAAVQTEMHSEQQVVMAQQGRRPLSKDQLRLCKGITSVILEATQNAREGYVAQAEQVLYKVRHSSLPFELPLRNSVQLLRQLLDLNPNMLLVLLCLS